MSENWEWERVEVKSDIEIPFEWKDKTPGGSNLGRAEFELCSVYKRGKLFEYFVFPRQQRNMHNYWHLQGGKDRNLTIGSYNGLEDANVWNTYWCKEHKTVCLCMYVPKDSSILRLSNYGLEFR